MNSSYEPEAYRGEGWVAFAGVMLMVAAFVNVIWGIGAIDNSTFFTDDERYLIFSDLNTWGWFLVIVGLVQFFAAFSIWNRQPIGQALGITFASLNAVILLFTVNAFPFAAFMLFIVDLLVIYGLATYGGPPGTHERANRRET